MSNFMGQKRTFLIFLLVWATMVALTGCSDDDPVIPGSGTGTGTDPGAIADITGYWQFNITSQTGLGRGIEVFYLVQNDDGSINGPAFNNTHRDGNTITGWEGFIGGHTEFIMIVGSSSMSGSYKSHENGTVSDMGTFVSRRKSFAGRVTMTGDVRGQNFNFNNVTGIGLFEDEGEGNRDANVLLINEDANIEFEIENIEDISGPGTYQAVETAVSSGQIELDLEFVFDDGVGADDIRATSGTVTFTRLSESSGMAGTFNLTFGGEGSVSGSFDVPWDYMIAEK